MPKFPNFIYLIAMMVLLHDSFCLVEANVVFDKLCAFPVDIPLFDRFENFADVITSDMGTYQGRVYFFALAYEENVVYLYEVDTDGTVNEIVHFSNGTRSLIKNSYFVPIDDDHLAVVVLSKNDILDPTPADYHYVAVPYLYIFDHAAGTFTRSPAFYEENGIQYPTSTRNLFAVGGALYFEGFDYDGINRIYRYNDDEVDEILSPDDAEVHILGSYKNWVFYDEKLDNNLTVYYINWDVSSNSIVFLEYDNRFDFYHPPFLFGDRLYYTDDVLNGSYFATDMENPAFEICANLSHTSRFNMIKDVLTDGGEKIIARNEEAIYACDESTEFVLNNVGNPIVIHFYNSDQYVIHAEVESGFHHIFKSTSLENWDEVESITHVKEVFTYQNLILISQESNSYGTEIFGTLDDEVLLISDVSIGPRSSSPNGFILNGKTDEDTLFFFASPRIGRHGLFRMPLYDHDEECIVDNTTVIVCEDGEDCDLSDVDGDTIINGHVVVVDQDIILGGSVSIEGIVNLDNSGLTIDGNTSVYGDVKIHDSTVIFKGLDSGLKIGDGNCISVSGGSILELDLTEEEMEGALGEELLLIESGCISGAFGGVKLPKHSCRNYSAQLEYKDGEGISVTFAVDTSACGISLKWILIISGGCVALLLLILGALIAHPTTRRKLMPFRYVAKDLDTSDSLFKLKEQEMLSKKLQTLNDEIDELKDDIRNVEKEMDTATLSPSDGSDNSTTST
eukprot:TRINITY_DN9861_c0_g1_i1.p1 TRINITY_DN9861_c0_g1~~TRINITY_DN9861_c0_g1_i1.p1  ORF type:complete len:745 (+),score=175.51 TRINITY_DN9861_c0_g1_i1:31-2235(+)